ncbi:MULTISPECIES: TadE/TadG family type IV pilus assembly protein [unclassified Mesorhizobium]|uniref:TadE/TadG family type IV pilus assembly protein n=1 Tax=unclassified Mesorhizobium TaxID=325217 RepID=UPI0003CF04DF|nr:TadE/TadG family type IV pilus assembly protein [Mesorhizobium sp. LNJC394B00]ESY23326.1 pilus biosynthesis protein TadE [Mesorhizobium sp. LNJC394B00]
MTKLGQIIRRFQGDERGAALVEVAITVPLVLLLSAGVFEFSNVLNTRLLLAAGVEDAARYMARCSSDWETTCKGQAQNLAANGAVVGGSARVAGWLPPTVLITKTSTPATDGSGNILYLSNSANVDVVLVSTTLPYNGMVFWDYLGFGSIDIKVSHQERVFGW